MSIEGPLRELGIHDVFQLLDLSRKSGVLSVTSALRDQGGSVYFERGAVVHAARRNEPYPLADQLRRAGKVTEKDIERARTVQMSGGGTLRLGDVLVSMGVIGRRPLERQVRFLIEEVVFDLMGWQDGYFVFDESEELSVPSEANIRIATDSLLMEGARRIDEWSHMEGVIPSLAAIPALAPADGDHASSLDLLPGEWAVLAEIDGARDLRQIAASLARSDFDVAKVMYGLATTGVVTVTVPTNGSGSYRAVSAPSVRIERAPLPEELEKALGAARLAVAEAPEHADARMALGRLLGRLARHEEAAQELRTALRLDSGNAAAVRELGFTAASRGALEEAIDHWGHYLRMTPNAVDEARVRSALDAALTLHQKLEEHAHV
ncbi:MAG: DUF4388 domain-containing protein [Gemmatimonadaceae bacterium]